MRFNYLPDSDEILDIAFRKARKAASAQKRVKDRLKNAKSREITKIETVKQDISDRLDKAINSVPRIPEMHAFNRELLGVIVSEDDLRKSLAKFKASRKIIQELFGKHLWTIKKAREVKKTENTRKAYYGRVTSIIKGLKKEIKIYNKASRKLKEFPKINFKAKHVILAGYPNTGKTTLLGRITHSKPEIANYPFTTKQINIGKFSHKYIDYEIIDTPGLLDRPIKQMNHIEKRAVLALKHLSDLICFVVDASENSYSFEKQLNLLTQLKTSFPEKKIIIILNKIDLCSKEQLEKAEKTFDGKKIKSLPETTAELKKSLAEILLT